MVKMFYCWKRDWVSLELHSHLMISSHTKDETWSEQGFFIAMITFYRNVFLLYHCFPSFSLFHSLLSIQVAHTDILILRAKHEHWKATKSGSFVNFYVFCSPLLHLIQVGSGVGQHGIVCLLVSMFFVILPCISFRFVWGWKRAAQNRTCVC